MAQFKLSPADLKKALKVFEQHEADVAAGLEREDSTVDVKTIQELLDV